MTEFQKEIIHIARMMATTLCFVILTMTMSLLGGLFMPNSVIDNKDIFPIIAPAFSTIIGGFIGWLAAIKLNNIQEEKMTQLTEHFTLEELTHTDHREFDNTPTTAEKCIIDGKEVIVNAYENLPRLAKFLEELKVVLGGKPIMVNSAFRSHDVNTAVGSKDTSDHRRGCAADIRVPGMTPDEVTRAIIASDLPYQQVIREFDRWTHVAITTNEGDTPKKSKLIIDKAGTRPFA